MNPVSAKLLVEFLGHVAINKGEEEQAAAILEDLRLHLNVERDVEPVKRSHHKKESA